MLIYESFIRQMIYECDCASAPARNANDHIVDLERRSICIGASRGNNPRRTVEENSHVSSDILTLEEYSTLAAEQIRPTTRS